MNTFKNILCITVLLILSSAGPILSQDTPGNLPNASAVDIPKTLSYQGVIRGADGQPLPNGLHSVQVSMYADEAGTILVWSDVYPLVTDQGLFNILLGSGETPLPSGAELNRALWVGVRVDGQQEMRPLSPLTSSPYALNVADKAVSTTKLQDGAVTADKMGTDYVAGISVNGVSVASRGARLNLVGGQNTSLAFDEQSNSIVVSAAGAQATDPTDTSSNKGRSKKDGGMLTEALGFAAIEGNGNGVAVINTLTMWEQNSQAASTKITNSSVTENLGVVLSTSDPVFDVNPAGGQYQINGSTVLHDFGTGNMFGGVNSGNQTLTTGSAIKNAGFGEGTLTSLTTGYYNTSVGYNALNSNTWGYDNVAIGAYAMSHSTSAYTNVAIGPFALSSITTGLSNIGIGYECGNFLTTPNNNTGVGFKSLYATTTGYDNSAYGYTSMYGNTTGYYNTSIGEWSLQTNTTGHDNTALGYSADVSSANLHNATAVGSGAIVTSSDNMQLGNTAVTAVRTAGTLTSGMTSGGTSGKLTLNDGSSNGYTTSFSLGSQSGNIGYVLPTAQGAASTMLSNDGSGNLSWVAGAGTVTNVTATSPLSSTGGATPDISLSGVVNVAHGGTGSSSLTANGIVIGEGTSAVNVATLSSGQLLVGQSSGDPLAKSVSGDATLASSGAVTVVGMQGVSVSTTAPTNGQVLAYDAGTSKWKPTAAGAGTVTNVTATAPLNSTGGATPDISLSGVVNVAHGGTGSSSLTANGIVIGEGTSAVNVATLASGELLVGQSSGDPLAKAVSGDATLASTGAVTVVGLQGVSVSTSAPTSGQVLAYDAGTSKWTPAAPGAGTVTSVTASAPLSSTGGATPDISLSGVVDVSHGGTGASSLTANGIMIGEGTSAVNVATLSSGQLLVGQSSGDPQAKSVSGDVALTSSGATTVVALQNNNLSNAAPGANDILTWSVANTQWEPTAWATTPGAVFADLATILGNGSVNNPANWLMLNLDNLNTWTNTVTIAPTHAATSSLVVKKTSAGSTVDVMDVSTSGGSVRVAIDQAFNMTVNNNLQVGRTAAPVGNGHLQTGGTNVVPVIAAGGNPVAVAANSGKDVAGQVTFLAQPPFAVPGQNAGPQIAIPVNVAYAAAATTIVVVSGVDAISAALQPFAFYNAAANQIIIGIVVNPGNTGLVYTFNYHVISVN